MVKDKHSMLKYSCTMCGRLHDLEYGDCCAVCKKPHRGTSPLQDKFMAFKLFRGREVPKIKAKGDVVHA